MQTGCIPNRNGMTTGAFQGQGGGLPAAEWTLASVLKLAGYEDERIFCQVRDCDKALQKHLRGNYIVSDQIR